MKLSALFKLAAQPGRTNLFVLAPDDLGLLNLLPAALAAITTPADVHVHDAESLSKDKARTLEREARLAPRGGSDLTHIFIHRLQRLPTDSAGPLLKAVEEAHSARFILQAQALPRKVQTLRSRCLTVNLAFLTKPVVLGNLKALNQDARTADQMDLYDGTLSGTLKALSMKDALHTLRRDLTRGQRGLATLLAKDTQESFALEPVLNDTMLPAERAYLSRENTEPRRRLVTFLTAARQV